jgi:PAS domain S-box-containing protein
MLFDANPHPMWVYDAKTLAFLAVNNAAAAHYGYSKDEFLRMSIEEVRSPAERQRLKMELARLDIARTNRAVFRHRKKNGALIDVEVISDHIDFEGRQARLVLAHDVTERLQAEAEVQRLNAGLEERVRQRTAELESVNRELEAFSYSVSHDLRAPLRHIAGFAELMREHSSGILDDSAKRYLGIISDSVAQMGKLIDDLLLFSKTGRADMHHERIDMQALVSEVVADCAQQMEGREIEWEIASLPEAQGDRPMLKQVWLNLISNAIKYSRLRERGTIKIGCQQNDEELEFYVQDNGAGFDMEYADKLFGVFQRLHRSEDFEGTGVGLANVQRIVSRHGGCTRAFGKVDEGATFYFSLPHKRGTS